MTNAHAAIPAWCLDAQSGKHLLHFDALALFELAESRDLVRIGQRDWRLDTGADGDLVFLFDYDADVARFLVRRGCVDKSLEEPGNPDPGRTLIAEADGSAAKDWLWARRPDVLEEIDAEGVKNPKAAPHSIG